MRFLGGADFMKKKYWIPVGILLGVTVAAGAMTVAPSQSNAAVLVFDEKNVAEAIKTAINSAKILTEEQKQLALELLNIKSLNENTITRILSKHTKATGGILAGDARIDPEVLRRQGKGVGVLNSGTTVMHVLQNEIGSVNRVLDGRETLVDLYKDSQKNYKTLEATYQDAMQAAANAQASSNTLADSVNDALDAANNAEGQMQAVQANAYIQAAQYTEARNHTYLLGQLVGAEVLNSYVKNRENAIRDRLDQESKDKLKKYVSH